MSKHISFNGILYEYAITSHKSINVLTIQATNDKVLSAGDLQMLKNELLGSDIEAIQVFPKNIKWSDDSKKNIYHLWTGDFNVPDYTEFFTSWLETRK